MGLIGGGKSHAGRAWVRVPLIQMRASHKYH